MVDASRSSRPKAEERRQQILDAASHCARIAGFHGSSMAEIAKTAGLSVGQIYRYFANKEAIIAAIVEQDQANVREGFAEMHMSSDGPASTLLSCGAGAVSHHYEADRAALVLEVMAEAARNPAVAAIVREADQGVRIMIRELLDQTLPNGVTHADRDARAEVFSMLFEGMAMRAVLNPDADRTAVAAVLRDVWRLLLLGAPANERASN